MMERHQIQATECFVRKDCPVCGVLYMVMEAFDIYKKEFPDSYFYCPNGHQLHYRKSRSEELEAELKDANKCLSTCRLALATSERMREQVEKKVKRTKGRKAP